MVCLALLAAVLGSHQAWAAAAIRIEQPLPDTAVYDLSGHLFVQAQLSAVDVVPEMRFRLLLDGRRTGRDSFVPIFELYDVPQGRHVLQVQIVGRGGQVMSRSELVGFRMVHGVGP